MKFGMRKPSPMRSVKSRTTAKWKRQAKRAIVPSYGKKGIGLLHPTKALYNRVYSRTTFGVGDIARGKPCHVIVKQTESFNLTRHKIRNRIRHS